MAQQPEQTIEQLKRRYDTLHTRKIQSETQRESAKEKLDQLQQQARTNYGTDDVAQLQAKLQELIDENACKRSAYQAHLDDIDRKLGLVETQFAGGAQA
jgi:DNA repair exonuclease SbcCD ATPase subunit